MSKRQKKKQLLLRWNSHKKDRETIKVKFCNFNNLQIIFSKLTIPSFKRIV